MDQLEGQKWLWDVTLGIRKSFEASHADRIIERFPNRGLVPYTNQDGLETGGNPKNPDGGNPVGQNPISKSRKASKSGKPPLQDATK